VEGKIRAGCDDASRSCSRSAPRSSFAGFRFPQDVVLIAVRWYLRYGQSYRDVEELLAERSIVVDHVTVHRWGCSGSPRCWLMRHDPAGTPQGIDGSWMKRMSSL
jgi:hypothetical protein